MFENYFVQGYIVQHGEHSQYFIITINGTYITLKYSLERVFLSETNSSDIIIDFIF